MTKMSNYESNLIGRYLNCRAGRASLTEMKEVYRLLNRKCSDKRLSDDKRYNYVIYSGSLFRMIKQIEGQKMF